MKFIVGGSIDRRTGEITDIYADCTEEQADTIVRNLLGIHSLPAQHKPTGGATNHEKEAHHGQEH